MEKRMASYRVLITGSRTWTNETLMREAFESINKDNEYNFRVILVHGTAKGADSMADKIGQELGWSIERHPADWNTHGKRAGFVRNSEMVSLGADICLAFIKENSRGATMCAALAEKKNIPTIRFEE
jgi:hypothetical protein